MDSECSELLPRSDQLACEREGVVSEGSQPASEEKEEKIELFG